MEGRRKRLLWEVNRKTRLARDGEHEVEIRRYSIGRRPTAACRPFYVPPMMPSRQEGGSKSKPAVKIAFHFFQSTSIKLLQTKLSKYESHIGKDAVNYNLWTILA